MSKTPDHLVTCPDCGTPNIYATRLGQHRTGKNCADRRKTLAPRPTAPQADASMPGASQPSASGQLSKVLTIAEEDGDAVRGLQLDMQWDRAIKGEAEQHIFGAMMILLEEHLRAAAGFDSTRGVKSGSGRYGTGTGMKAWLAKYAPKVKEATAYRWKKATQGLLKKSGIPDAEALQRLLGADADELTEPERATQLELFTLIEGTSQTELLGADSAAQPALEKLTPAQAVAQHRQEVESGVTEIMKHDFFKADSWEIARPEILEPFAQFLRDEADKIAKWCRLSPEQRRQILLKRAVR